MNKLEQAARQLLFVVTGCAGRAIIHPDNEAITAMREALSEQAEQEPFDMDDHPPHRLCECRKCMEYFTPLPDCDAFAASGKPIAEQEPVAVVEITYGREPECYVTGNIDDFPEGVFKLYAAPVQQVDLTKEDRLALWKKWNMTAAQIDAVIAKFKEKNKC